MSVNIHIISCGSVTSHMAEISILFYWILQLYTPDAKVDSSSKNVVYKGRYREEIKPSLSPGEYSVLQYLKWISDLFLLSLRFHMSRSMNEIDVLLFWNEYWVWFKHLFNSINCCSTISDSTYSRQFMIDF